MYDMNQAETSKPKGLNRKSRSDMAIYDWGIDLCFSRSHMPVGPNVS